MSVAGLVRLTQPKSSQGPTDAGLSGAQAETQPALQQERTAMEKITTFIPSEVVGIYVAGLAIFAPTTSTPRWVLLVLGAVLVPVFFLLSQVSQGRSRVRVGLPSDKLVGWRRLVLMSFDVVAFVAWAAALPGGAFASKWGADATRAGGFAVIVLTPLLYGLADALKLVQTKDVG